MNAVEAGPCRTEETPAIRTPEDYVAALDAALAALGESVQARRDGSPGAEALALRAEAMAEAVSRAPFRMQDGRVVAKGFTPRVVRAS